MNVQECVRTEEISLNEYVNKKDEWMLRVVRERVMVEESKAEYVERMERERSDRFESKRLHGRFFRDVREIADVRSWQWLRGGFLAKSTEAYMFAAQEQALRTRSIRAHIEGADVDPSCRMCGKTNETVSHLVAGCSTLAQRDYRRRHDRMGLRVYWELCKKYGVKHSGEWFEETPEEVRVSGDQQVEILWDINITTATRLDHNRPDVVVIDKKKKSWQIIDFSVPLDSNVINKENEKLKNYAPLAAEIRRMHGVRTTVVPIVVGALGTVSKRLTENLKKLGVPDVLGGLQTSAIKGTTDILRKTLSL